MTLWVLCKKNVKKRGDGDRKNANDLVFCIA